jgi:DNA (cytosine-5)-methyltransferase 1
MRPRLLDLFCGAGGCSVGYHRAGFDVVGVDNRPQPRYPFPFVQADALEHLAAHGREYDAVHASPPCQGYSQARFVVSTRGREYPMLLKDTFDALERNARPWMIENVGGSPLYGIQLCGTMFGLAVRRHRVFEAPFMLLAPADECRHRVTDYGVYAGKVTKLGTKMVAYTASTGRTHYRPEQAQAEHAAEAMGIDWMTLKELCQAIPPAYTEYVGRQLLRVVEGGAPCARPAT